MNERIAILTGAFNPPHKGHEAVIHALVTNKELALAKIWLMPNVFDNAKRISVSPQMRMDMIKLMIEESFAQSSIAVEISNLIVEQTHEINPYQTKIELQKKFPNSEFIFVIGTDLLPNLSRLPDGNKLLVTSKFILINRGSTPSANLPANILPLSNLKKVETTSAQLRYLIHTNKVTENLISKKVLEYIQARGLYKS